MKNFYFVAFLVFCCLTANAQQAPIISVNFNPDEITAVGIPGFCTQLPVNYYPTKKTTDYDVSAFTGQSFANIGGAVIPVGGDDIWSEEITLPFSFCFYGEKYDKMLIGTNGVVTFDTTGQIAGALCPYEFTSTIPDANFPIKNAIYGVYQDNQSILVANPDIQNINYYFLDTGYYSAPNRVCVINFTELRQFGCATTVGLQTSQIILHEGTNIIDVYTNKRTPCTSINSGNGLIGIQNQSGTLAKSPLTRNTGAWSAMNEGWRFEPNGEDLTQLTWSVNSTPISDTSNPLTVCPFSPNELYTASVNFGGCMLGPPYTITQVCYYPLFVTLPVFDPNGIYVCAPHGAPYIANIDQTEYMFSAVSNPGEYYALYYNNYSDAISSSLDYIENPSAYSFNENQPIYVRIENLLTDVVNIRTFELLIHGNVAPAGDEQQNFIAGQTLADLSVTGQNIIWYDAEIGGNVLPETTILQNHNTYYTSQQTPTFDCESIRLAVTANLVLATKGFDGDVSSVYPNPATSAISISFAANIKSVEICNTVGQKVMAQYPDKKEVRLDVSKLAVGIYFVKINSATKQQTIKVIKN